jgi:hypothetical protein
MYVVIQMFVRQERVIESCSSVCCSGALTIKNGKIKGQPEVQTVRKLREGQKKTDRMVKVVLTTTKRYGVIRQSSIGTELRDPGRHHY